MMTDDYVKVQMSLYDIMDWVSFAIQEALNGNNEELEQALDFIEQVREQEKQWLTTQ